MGPPAFFLSPCEPDTRAWDSSVRALRKGEEGLLEMAKVSTLEGLPLRIGLVATDPLRIVGFQAVLGALAMEVVLLSVPRALDMAGLSIVLIDADATGHLFELLGAFRLRRPQLRLIVLGDRTKGYLGHTAPEADLAMAIKIVGDGSVWAPRKVMAVLLEQRERATSEREMPKFTVREAEVVELLVLGHPNREIAQELGVDAGTVKAHVGRLMRKLGVDNRTALTVRLLDMGMGNSSSLPIARVLTEE